MRKTVLYRQAGSSRYRPTRVIGAKRDRIPGMPWFKCFTNRWWSPLLAVEGVHRYMLTEDQTGLVPATLPCESRRAAKELAIFRLRSRKKSVILAAIARVKAGHLDRNRIPQRFKHRTR